MAEIDFDDWIKDFKVPEIKYFATFDPKTFKVTGVYPGHVVTDPVNSIEIDNETATSINDGTIQLQSCFVDSSSGKFQIAELTNLTKIDDVLHRVIDKQWSKEIDHDVYITHDTKNNKFIFELSEKYRGTRHSENKVLRTIHWATSTEMSFLVTDYNDPTVVRQTIKFSIDDLIGQTVLVDCEKLPDRFSIYTRRLFPLYVMETK